MRYGNNCDQQLYDLSMCPSTMDQSQNYEDVENTIRNPLASYWDSNDCSAMGRSGFSIVSFTNTDTNATIIADITEPLFLSPFLYGQGQEPGFIGVQNMDFTWTLGNLSRMWSHSDAGGSVFNANFPSVTIGQPSLLFRYITPQSMETIPRVMTYPYYVIQRYPTEQLAAIAPLGITTIPSQNIQLQSIPRRFYIYVRQRNQDLTFLDTDTFFSIENISVNWNNRSGVLASAQKQDLYSIARKNGINMSWTQFSGETTVFSGSDNITYGTIGSLIAIDMGKDIGLRSDEAPGLLGTYQLQINVLCKNVNTLKSLVPALYIVVVSEGSYTIMNNTSIPQIAVLSKMDIINAQAMKGIDYEEARDYYGGDFMGDVGRFLKGAWTGLTREVLPGIEQILGIVAKAVPLLAMAAGNVSEKEVARILKDLYRGQGKYGGVASVGGNVVYRGNGGQVMPSNQLAYRVRNY